jgi:hypothetical protein
MAPAPNDSEARKHRIATLASKLGLPAEPSSRGGASVVVGDPSSLRGSIGLASVSMIILLECVHVAASHDVSDRSSNRTASRSGLHAERALQTVQPNA